ncbi:MAG: isocitrate dehydrogenase (NADP(+)) [Candidatus Eisenbacteria bacterium]|nr:isocitrate dehydrogenase (NADP(+)) [Candidatus Eisenbacteria bacterium]
MSATSFEKLSVPEDGELIQIDGPNLKVPNRVILPFIEGDGTGGDIWRASVRVFDAAVKVAYGGERSVVWWEVYAGEKANALYGGNVWLPEDTLKAIKLATVAIKGPLTTPVGGGIRSLNVGLRQELDLYACVRPVKWVPGVPSPVREPQKLDVVIFRENTEDVYAGIEWAQGSPEALALIDYIGKNFGKKIRLDSGIGIKPISITGTERLVRKAINYAIKEGRKSVTLVHKGNIMKFTEGAFRDWGYALAIREFRDQIITEEELWANGGTMPAGKILIKDRIADSIFQQVLLRPDEYEVLCTPNLNGDYLSDACAAQIGGLGMAPGSNIADHIGVFEATHGTAPKYADKDVINPGSVILSGVMMFEYLGWKEAANVITKALATTVDQKRVTYDLERLLPGSTLLKCSEFGSAIIENMKK